MRLDIKAEVIRKPGQTKGIMHFTIADTTTIVTEGPDGKELGRIAPCIGGGIELQDKASGFTYFIRPEDMWTAFQMALVDEDLT
jgi:hypothetical protein